MCPWNIGDVFEYRIESELAKSRGLYGKYFLVQKVDETTWYPGHIIPIVYVKIATELPRSLEEYNRLEFVQTSFSYYEERFWPVDMNCPEKDIAQKSKSKEEWIVSSIEFENRIGVTRDGCFIPNVFNTDLPRTE